MGFLKPKSSKPNPVQPTPLPPDRSSSEVADLAAQQRDKLYGSSNGAVSTMLTGGLGIPGKQPSATVKLFGQNVG